MYLYCHAISAHLMPWHISIKICTTNIHDIAEYDPGQGALHGGRSVQACLRHLQVTEVVHLCLADGVYSISVSLVDSIGRVVLS